MINPAIAHAHAHEGNPGVDHHHYAQKNAQNEASELIQMLALDPEACQQGQQDQS